MNRLFCFVLMWFVFAITIVLSCGCESSSVMDEPDPSDTITSGLINEDSIANPEDTIEPLTEYLRPAMTKGKTWIRERKYDRLEYGIEINLDTLFLGQDSVVNGRKCQMYDCDKYYEFMNQSFIVSIGAVSEEDGKVYYLDFSHDDTDWCVLFDLNVQSADPIKAKTCTIIPLSRGTIVLMGCTRRAVKVRCTKDYELCGWNDLVFPYDYWVEGIGMLYGHYPLSVYPPQNFSCREYNYPQYHRLRECWDGDEKIYDYREFSDELYTPIEIFADDPA